MLTIWTPKTNSYLYSEIVARDDMTAKEENTINMVSEPKSTFQGSGLEKKQKTGIKRKSNDAHEADMVTKNVVSIAEKQKKKKKQKIAANEQVKYNDGNKSQKKSMSTSSSLANNGNVGMKKKVKTKSKVQPSATDSKSKGSSKDEIDDIFGF
jgi:hypothetical protein